MRTVLPCDLRCMLRCLSSAALILSLSLGALPDNPLPTPPSATDAERAEETVAASLFFSQCAFSDDLELELLARVVAAEVGEYSYAAQTAFAAMLLNRLTDPRFPSDLGAVIGDAGLRALHGEIPTRALRAASAARLGVDPTAGALYCHPAVGTAPPSVTAVFDGLAFSR